MSFDLENKRKQLVFRAGHRGFKEADLVLGGFAGQALDGMSAAELDAFERLLSHADQDIYDWVMDRGTPETREFDDLLNRIKAFVRAGGAVIRSS